jgi:hypothetical protein
MSFFKLTMKCNEKFVMCPPPPSLGEPFDLIVDIFVFFSSDYAQYA